MLGALDIDDFLDQEIRGPATFSCKSGAGCVFEEPGMNDLINTIFGDDYISLKCNSGECLHVSQVPGYVVRWDAVFAVLFSTEYETEPSYARQYSLVSVKRFRRDSFRAYCVPWYVVI